MKRMHMWDFLFPRICQHCEMGWGLLCRDCMEHLEWKEEEEKSCGAYQQRACFERCGPILSVAGKKRPGVMKALAALMVVGYERMGWFDVDGVMGDGLLGRYFADMVGKKRKGIWTDKEVLVVSVWPLDFKSRVKVFEKFPKKVVNFSLV